MERMKVAYFGECDNLTAGILERLNKEEKDVYFLSGKAVIKEDKIFSKYRHYLLTGEKDETERIFASITPDVVIYEGTGYLNEKWNANQSENLSLLSQILEECARLENCRLVLLSSTEIYGRGMEKATWKNVEKRRCRCCL